MPGNEAGFIFPVNCRAEEPDALERLRHDKSGEQTFTVKDSWYAYRGMRCLRTGRRQSADDAIQLIEYSADSNDYRVMMDATSGEMVESTREDYCPRRDPHNGTQTRSRPCCLVCLPTKGRFSALILNCCLLRLREWTELTSADVVDWAAVHVAIAQQSCVQELESGKASVSSAC